MMRETHTGLLPMQIEKGKTKMNRRDFIKATSAATLTAAALNVLGAEAGKTALISRQAPVVGCENVTGRKVRGTRAKVYFTRRINAESLIALYDRVSQSIYGKVAVKLHTGEPKGPNIIPPAMARPLLEHIPESTIVETNTMYDGGRYTTAGHRKTLKINGWTFCPVDILDEEGDVSFLVRRGFHLKEVAMGGHLANYDSLVVLTHFKGHAMGGFGGSLKNIAIGCASGQGGKRQVHGYPTGDMPPAGADWGKMPDKETFMELMADSGKAICDYFGKRIVFLNVMRRMSVSCDCEGVAALEPTIPDIGILASTDILAIDQASVDLVYSSESNKDLVERIESRHGLRQLSAMRELKMGNSRYELIDVTAEA